MKGALCSALPWICQEEKLSGMAAQRNAVQTRAVPFVAPRCLQGEGDWLQAFCVVTVHGKCGVISSVSLLIGLDRDWHDAGQFSTRGLI